MRRSHAGTAAVVAAVAVVALVGCGRSARFGTFDENETNTSVPNAAVAVDEQDLLGPWTDATGRSLPDGTKDSNGVLVVSTSAGSTTCSADGTVFLQLAWPVGTEVDIFNPELDMSDAPQFIRDTSGSAMDTVGSSDLDTTLPRSARPTGFRRAGNTISVESTAMKVYVTRPDGRTERWARLRSGGCA